MIKAKQNWHKEAKNFLKKIQDEYTFSRDEESIVLATCDQLSHYWRASDRLETDGMILTSEGGMARKNPLCEIVKNSWAGFLSGCRLMGIGGPEVVKNRGGRPNGIS